MHRLFEFTGLSRPQRLSASAAPPSSADIRYRPKRRNASREWGRVRRTPEVDEFVLAWLANQARRGTRRFDT